MRLLLFRSWVGVSAREAAFVYLGQQRQQRRAEKTSRRIGKQVWQVRDTVSLAGISTLWGFCFFPCLYTRVGKDIYDDMYRESIRVYCTKALGEVEVGARFRFRGNWCVGRPFGVIVPMVPLAGERAACKQWISDSAQEHMIWGVGNILANGSNGYAGSRCEWDKPTVHVRRPITCQVHDNIWHRKLIISDYCVLL